MLSKGLEMGMGMGERKRCKLASPCDYKMTWKNRIGDENMPPSPPSQGPKMATACDYGSKEIFYYLLIAGYRKGAGHLVFLLTTVALN